MSHRSYALILAASILGIGAAFAAGSAWLEPLSGDLARIGRFDEADYGWRENQTRFMHPLFQINPGRVDHDILVLGDSFSNDGAAGWPNYVAAETGARIAIVHVRGKSWRAVLDEPSYRTSPPKVFILEVVERDLKEILGSAPRSCGADAPAPSPRVSLPQVRRTAVLENVDRPTRRTFAQLDPLHFAQFEWARLLRHLGRSSGEAVEVALARQAFSSRRVDSTLIYAGDLLKRFWTASDLKAVDCGIRAIQDAVQRDRRTLFLTMLVPDKLTAYSPDLVDQSLTGFGVLDRLDSIASVPVATALAREIRAGTLDVYLPDDSHLGSAGQEATARALVDELRLRGVLPPASHRLQPAN